MGYAHGALTDYSGDSAQYLGIATRAPWSSDFLLASKPWTVPLLYKLAGGRLHAGYAQFAASIASWLALAAVAAAIVRERRVGIAAAVLVLLFSLSIWITQWDKLVLSESLSVSLAAAAVAAWMALVTWPRALTLAAALVITLLWVFTRDTNAYVLLFALAPLAVWLVRSSQTRRIAAIALVGAAAVAAASLESASAGQGCFESGSPVRFEPSKHAALAARGFCVRRWYTLVNTIGVRIVPDSQARSYFVARGMPVPPLMRRLSGQLLGIVPNTYSDPSMAGFRHWLDAHGRQTYASYLLSHPGEIVPSGGVLDALVSPHYSTKRVFPPLTQWRGPARQVLPGPVQSVVFPPTTLCLGIELAIAAALIAAALRRRARLARAWVVPAFLVVVTPLHALVVWHGDPADVTRHALLVGVLARLGLLLLALLAAGALATRTRGRASGTSRP